MASEKFPCFNWFPRDWIAGTAELTAEQKGVFADLLSYAWEQTPPCTLPDDDAVLARLAGLPVARWRKICAPIMLKFERAEGRLRNPKLWSVYQDMVGHRQKRREAGQKGNETRWGSQSDGNAMPMGSPPTPSPTNKKTDGACAPRNGTAESVGQIVARITPAVNQ